MSYQKVEQANTKVIGTKQVLKALEQGIAETVIIASDADIRVVQKVRSLAEKLDVPIIIVDSMKRLGKSCRIDVGAACVVLTK